MSSPYELIRKKRNGEALSYDEIRFLVSRFTAGRIPDYQFSSFLMAVFFKGMNDQEILDLTRAMMETGRIMDLSDVPGCKADKHSTGGVGDKISLLLAPLAAACGINVPMISGRGLGHTGGTIDKLESIPGFRADLSVSEYKKILKKVGLVMSSQSDILVPADRIMYALRDVTATVESIPLITSSIMSKKLAEGIDSLVLDVKVGSGAFMKTLDGARDLALKMVQVGKLYGKKVTAYLTDMNQPLGTEIGNLREVVEAAEILKGERISVDILELTTTLSAEMISLCTGENISFAERKVKDALDSGNGYEKFCEMVSAQGGRLSAIEKPAKTRKSKYIREIKSSGCGFVASIDTYKVGMSAVRLGAGRMKVGDKIDPLAGITILKKVGDRVSTGDVIGLVYTNDLSSARSAVQEIGGSYGFSDVEPAKSSLILERIG